MEIINLNLIPTGTRPVVHASQYDNGRQFRANLFEGASVYTLTGAETLTFSVRKPDGHIVTEGVTNTSDNYVVIETTTQMCACAGNSFAELKIENGDDLIGTLNLILAVEQSPEEGGDPSESFIHNLRTQIAEGVAEEVAEQYDSANVIFDNVPTSGHGTPYTVTSEGIKTAIDNAFDYDNTASGSLVHIEDGADNIPVKSLVSEIVAVQSGSGTPSPNNQRAISGFDSGIVSVCGVNLWDEVYELGTIDNVTGAKVNANNRLRSKNFIRCLPNTNYFAKLWNNTDYGLRLFFYDNAFNFINSPDFTKQGVFTTPNNATYILFILSTAYGTTYNNDISINYPSSDTQYHAYNGNNYTFAFGQTVYGGHFDNKGNLVVTHGCKDLGTLTWLQDSAYGSYFYTSGFSDKASGITNMVCSEYGITTEYGNQQPDLTIRGAASGNVHRLFIRNNACADATAFNTAIQGAMLCYELATPITLAITSQDIPTLLGENNIFSNCGDVEVNYYTNKANDILDFIDSEIGKKNGTNILIEEGSQDSIKDYIDNVSLSGLSDTDISGETSGQILAYDGAKWVNTNQIVVKYEEKDIAFGADGEGTLFTTLTNVINVIDVTNDTNYVGYFHYFARGGAVRVKPFNRAVTGFDSSTFANTTRKVGIYYLDNITTE